VYMYVRIITIHIVAKFMIPDSRFNAIN